MAPMDDDDRPSGVRGLEILRRTIRCPSRREGSNHFSGTFLDLRPTKFRYDPMVALANKEPA